MAVVCSDSKDDILQNETIRYSFEKILMLTSFASLLFQVDMTYTCLITSLLDFLTVVLVKKNMIKIKFQNK